MRRTVIRLIQPIYEYNISFRLIFLTCGSTRFKKMLLGLIIEINFLLNIFSTR